MRRWAMLKGARVAAVCLSLTVVSGAVCAADSLYYRYENNEGVTVIDDHVPPQFTHKGYAVLNEHGRVVEVVPRVLTEAERRRSGSSQVQEQLRAEERVRQRRYDEVLLTRYSAVSDVEATRERRVNGITLRINGLKGNITGFSKAVDERQREAADLEREGQQVPAELLNELAKLRADIADAEQRMEAYEAERKTTEARFQYDIERVRILRPDAPRPAEPVAPQQQPDKRSE